jgi:hypothetical protein
MLYFGSHKTAGFRYRQSGCTFEILEAGFTKSFAIKVQKDSHSPPLITVGSGGGASAGCPSATLVIGDWPAK